MIKRLSSIYLFKVVVFGDLGYVATDATNILPEVLQIDCSDQGEPLQDADVSRVRSGGDVFDRLADAVELVGKFVEALLDVLWLCTDEGGLGEERLKAAPSGVVCAAEAGAAVGLVVLCEAVLRTANGGVRHRVVWWRAKTLDERGTRRERVPNARRRLRRRDLWRKRLAALEVHRLAGVPTVSLCAALSIVVFAADLDDAVDLLGNG
jgi:hypothetical protein